MAKFSTQNLNKAAHEFTNKHNRTKSVSGGDETEHIRKTKETKTEHYVRII